MSTATEPTLLSGVETPNGDGDPQIRAYLDRHNSSFNQWKHSHSYNRSSAVRRLLQTLKYLLTRLLGARDYCGAAQALTVLYSNFTLSPTQSVLASLEIFRRQPQPHKEAILQYYRISIENELLNKPMFLQELLLFYISYGDFYEAYDLFKNEIQPLGVEQNVHVMSIFGMLCYWMLFIESEEVREKYKQDDYVEEIEQESIPSIIERRYLFKPRIGVHILYQEASHALRRAVSLAPESIVFIEYYVQILALVGDIEQACDHLEHMYHLDPTNVHTVRMLVGFLECYYPDSVDSQVSLYLRWLENDPSCLFAIDKLMDHLSSGSVTSSVLAIAFAKALDTIGGDLYLGHSVLASVQLWEYFARLVIDQIEWEDGVLEQIQKERRWWIRVFLSRPSTSNQVLDLLHSDKPEWMETLIHKAFVGERLFMNEGSIIANAIHVAITTDESRFDRHHIRLFNRYFPPPVHLNPTSCKAPFAFTTLKTLKKRKRTTTALHDAVTILDRHRVISKDTLYAHQPKVMITGRNESTESEVEMALCNALELAVREAVFDQERRMVSSSTVIKVPTYVTIIEELMYKRHKRRQYGYSRHLQSQIDQQLETLDGSLIIPTPLEVVTVLQFFYERWTWNESMLGHPGLLLRYELYLTKFLRKRAEQTNYWKDFHLSPAVVSQALEEMKRHVSRSHQHFPSLADAEILMRKKISSLARLRRQLLRDYMMAMRVVVHSYPYVETSDLVNTAIDVAIQNHHLDLLSTSDLERWAVTVLASRYIKIVRRLKYHYREFLLDPSMRGNVIDATIIYDRLCWRYKHASATFDAIKAFVWLKKWETQQVVTLYDLIL